MLLDEKTILPKERIHIFSIICLHVPTGHHVPMSKSPKATKGDLLEGAGGDLSSPFSLVLALLGTSTW